MLTCFANWTIKVWLALFSPILWLLFIICIDLPLILLGWIVVPLAVLCKAYEADPVSTTDIYHFTWPALHLWDNFEDGVAGGTQYYKAPTLGRQIIYWSALRNPVNNLRLVPYLSVKIDRFKVKYIGSFDQQNIFKYDTPMPQWFFAWQGIYSCFYWQFNWRGHLRRLWIGWKIYPTDIYGVTPYRAEGAGFALQFKIVK